MSCVCRKHKVVTATHKDRDRAALPAPFTSRPHAAVSEGALLTADLCRLPPRRHCSVAQMA